MIWRGSTADLDLLQGHKTVMAAEPPRRGSAACRTRGIIVRMTLVFVVLVLGVEITHIYLNIQSLQTLVDHMSNQPMPRSVPRLRQVSEKEEETEPELPLLMTRQSQRVVVYSYHGVETLPLASVMADLLNMHPSVFFLHQPDQVLNGNAAGFPKHNSRQIGRQIESLQSCETQILRRLHNMLLPTTQPPVLRHGKRSQGGVVEWEETVKRCLSSNVSALDLYARNEMELRDLITTNGTALYVHFLADPRLVTFNLWLAQRHGNGEEISLTNDVPVIRSIARDYCSKLMRDIRTMKKLKGVDSDTGLVGSRYHVVRYESLVSEQRPIIRELFNFLSLHETEGITNYINHMEEVKLADLYEDVRLNVIEIAEPECSKVMEMVGYVPSAQLENTGSYIQPYNEWWL